MDPLEQVTSQVRAGVAMVREGRLDPPPQRSWLHRLSYGMALVTGVLRAVLAHPETRQRYVKIVGWQLLATLVVGYLYVTLFEHLPERYDRSEGSLQIHFARTAAFWASFYVTLSVVEWIVIALSRDFHDELGHRASLLVGVPPEEPSLPAARVRLNIGWAWSKLRRRIHGFFILAAGVPTLALLLLVPDAGDALFSVAVTAWAAWWLVVFTVGKTAYAWSNEPPREPWFLHVFERAAAHTSLLRWFLPRWYLALWRRVCGATRRPAFLVENMLFEALGLGLVRMVCGLPGLYLLLRPLFPVAAAVALQRSGVELRVPDAPVASPDAPV